MDVRPPSPHGRSRTRQAAGSVYTSPMLKWWSATAPAAVVLSRPPVLSYVEVSSQCLDICVRYFFYIRDILKGGSPALDPESVQRKVRM